jgi:hypothetical protein
MLPWFWISNTCITLAAYTRTRTVLSSLHAWSSPFDHWPAFYPELTKGQDSTADEFMV